ncbi:MAG: hypothetical protein ACYCPW_03770 [Nitrososphaerales archaeon]
MIILHPFEGKPERKLDEFETWKCLEPIRQIYTVVDRECPNFAAYARFLAEYWGQGEDILVWESDKVAGLSHVQSLEQCAEVSCGYLVYSNYEALPRSEYGPGLAFVRFRKEVQRSKDWQNTIYGFDGWVHSSTGVSMHVHDEILRHNHSYATLKWARFLWCPVCHKRFPTIIQTYDHWQEEASKGFAKNWHRLRLLSEQKYPDFQEFASEVESMRAILLGKIEIR